MEFREKIISAAKYVKNGDPLKDVLDDVEICVAIELLAAIFKAENKADKYLNK